MPTTAPSPDASVAGSDNYTAPSGTTATSSSQMPRPAGDGGTTDPDSTDTMEPASSSGGGASNADGSGDNAGGTPGGASPADAGTPAGTSGSDGHGTGDDAATGSGGHPPPPELPDDAGLVTGAAGNGGASDPGSPEGSGGAASNGYCYGELYAKLTAPEQAQNFYIDFGLNSVDLSNTTLSLRLRADYPGDEGGILFFLLTTNGGSSFANWTNLDQLGPWTTLTVTPEDFARTPGMGFTPTEVLGFGIQITSGVVVDSTWGDVALVVDSITFSDQPELDMHFGDEMPPFESSGDAADSATRLRACDGS